MLDIVALMWHKTGTLKNCESGPSGLEGPGTPRCAGPLCGSKAVDDITICKRTGQRQRSKRSESFSARKRQRFLDALALACNVNAASDYAGIGRTTPYRWRARDPHFARQWQDALATGYDRLETLVLEHGGAGVPLEPANPERVKTDDAHAPPPFDFERALRVLALYRKQRHDLPGRRSGALPKRATREETNAALLKALTAAKKRLERPRDA